MEEQSNPIGPKGLIKRNEFIRVIIQCLYSLGYKKTASCLESESNIPYKSVSFIELESYVLNGNFDACVHLINSIAEMSDEVRKYGVFLVFKQCLLEYLNGGSDSLALNVLRKQVPSFRLSKDKVCELASSILCLEKVEIDRDGVIELRRRLLMELRDLLPPCVVIKERRLEHLVETALMSQIDCCLYHNESGSVSVFEDHCCGRDQIPTETVQVLTEHSDEVWFVQFSNNGKYLASSSSDRTAIIWTVRGDDVLELKHTLTGHQNPVSYVAWSPDDTKLVTCGKAKIIKLWDVETGICKHTFGDNGFIASSCAWFPDSKRFVYGSSNPEKGIFMWDCNGNEIKASSGMQLPRVSDLAITPDGKFLITIQSDKEIRILNLETDAERIVYENDSVISLSVSLDSKFFIVNLTCQEIHLWDVAGELKMPLKYTGHQQNKYVVRSCFGGSDCSFIASGSEDSKVYMWNRRNSKPIEVLSGHSTTVNCVSWNPKRHRMLASASDDGTIRIWGPSESSKKQ